MCVYGFVIAYRGNKARPGKVNGKVSIGDEPQLGAAEHARCVRGDDLTWVPAMPPDKSNMQNHINDYNNNEGTYTYQK